MVSGWAMVVDRVPREPSELGPKLRSKNEMEHWILITSLMRGRTASVRYTWEVKRVVIMAGGSVSVDIRVVLVAVMVVMMVTVLEEKKRRKLTVRDDDETWPL